MDAKKPDEEWRDCPTAWFSLLEKAKETHNFERAAEAERQLARLGVRVKYTRPAKAVANA